MFKSDTKLAKSRDMNFVNAARAVLASFGIGHADKPPAAYLEQLYSYDPDQGAAMQGLVNDATYGALAAQGDYGNLPYNDFQSVQTAVESLWNLSRRIRQIEIDGVKIDRDQVREELGARLSEISKPGPRRGYHEAVSPLQKAKLGLMGLRAATRRVESWVRAVDAADPAGPFRRYLWNPIREGTTAYRVAKEPLLKRYGEIVKGLEGAMSHERIASSELAYTFDGTREVLGALLHTGNESNFQKLLRGRGWGTIDEHGILDTSRWDAFVSRMQKEGILTKVHYDYAQAVWSLFESFKPATQKAHMEMYGHYFSEITAKPFDTPFGSYKGGYVPAKADPFIVQEAAIRNEQAILEGNDNSFAFPSTGRGSTMTRVEAYARPLILDANYVGSHIDWAMRFTHIQPRVKDVARLVMDRAFREQLEGLDPTVGGDMLVPWLQRAANQRIDQPMKGWGGRFAAAGARELRSRAGLQVMAANMMVTAEQITHFPSTFVLVKASSVMDALWRFTRAPHDVAESVTAKSDFMATRESAGLMEIRKSIDNIMLDPSLITRGNDWIAEHGTFLMRSIQSVMDHVTWSAAYDEAIAGGATELEAVRRSDSIVREALGSYAAEDLSRFETGNSVARLFSMFYSFYNTKANLLASEFTATTRSMGLRKGAGRLLYIYTWGFMVPAVLGGAIKQAMSGKPFDEEDDGPVDDAFRLFFGSQAEMATRMIPFAGPAVQFAVDRFGQYKPGGILNSPAVHLIEEALSAPHDVYKAIQDRMVTKKEITDVLTLLGLLTNLPLRPLSKLVPPDQDERSDSMTGASGSAHIRFVCPEGTP